MSLNDNQKQVAETLNGLLMVDAGPGTGKTHTIVERYANLVKDKVPVRDILMVTFTRNAAEEMKDRISRRMRDYAKELRDSGDRYAAEDIEKSISDIRTSTFDSYCSRIVSNSPEFVSDFFGFKETLSRNARLIENESMNVDYFTSFFNSFVKEKGRLYVKENINVPALFAGNPESLFKLISKLMSRGIIPLADYDWFGNGLEILMGDQDEMRNILDSMSFSNGIYDHIKKLLKEDYTFLPNISPLTDNDGMIELVVNEDRKLLIYFIHDIYYSFIKKSVSDNRLTFGLNALFAFIVLYQDQSARTFNSVRYLMIDEFQDTNEMQLMTSLMLLNEGNLCVVGDWKQGIYGFRDVSTDNIRKFSKRIVEFGDILNNDGEERVRFDTRSKVFAIALRENYRSSSLILENAFRSMNIAGSDREVDTMNLISDDDLVLLDARNDDTYGCNTEFEAFYSEDEEEYNDIVDRVKDYLFSGRYKVCSEDGLREPKPSDIGILFRTINGCLKAYNALRSAGIPAYLQGDDTIMATRPGKLVLAWLRYVNDFRDKNGLTAILINEGYTITQIRKILKDNQNVPKYIVDERNYLLSKRKRPNDLITSIMAFHRIGESDDAEADIAQTIINIISLSYSNSLVTISDIIRLIENDLELNTKYAVEQSADKNAVMIQTMHKSKGLEYPFVIVGGLNKGVMPSTQGDKSPFIIDDIFGFRVSKEYQTIVDDTGVEFSGILPSWRFKFIKSLTIRNYDEERRLMFVAMSRARQYLTLMGRGDKPSMFLKHYNPTNYKKSGIEVADVERFNEMSEVPKIPEYAGRRMNISVHDLTEMEPEIECESGDSTDKGDGKEYGNLVHRMAEQMASGRPYDELPESENIRAILNSMKDSVILTEIHCSLPIKDVTLRGIIDVIGDFGDRIEIHDYKTDRNERYLNQYKLQISIYAHAVSQARGVPVTCYIDMVSLGRSIKVEPLSMDEIEKKVEKYLFNIRISNVTDLKSKRVNL